ncbi:hypothetical protein EXIGLDRAFT_839806 [Exidia glandulosa HHB12029]|uniref:Lysine-specific metallo-endopeptidase domain-containing protein n=1 Tax=Exidia glandulosa HHB12029 TaxID=1314781 RepID=A0A165ETB4_EXIGL|nr:hypothetical protein EXIGLDRAFT_839806 [Exidia glandulosa HHB12029]
MLQFVSLAVVLASSPLALAALGKDTLFKNGLTDPLADYYDSIPKPPSSRVDMPAPDMCIQHAEGKCDASAVEAVSVKYDDCDVPWTLCRCNDANMSMDTIVDRFGQLPPGIRSYVGSLIAVHADGPSAGSSGDFITFNGDCNTSVFLHEASHSLDQGTSPSQGWTDALGASSCVPDDYANSSPAEDFAQVDVLYVYTKRHGPLPADPSCLQAQLDYMANTPRIRDAEASATCNADVRPFTLDPPAAPAPEPAPEPTPTPAPEPAPEPTPTEAPAPPPETPAPTPTPVPAPAPSQCPAGMRRRSEKEARRLARRLAPHRR